MKVFWCVVLGIPEQSLVIEVLFRVCQERIFKFLVINCEVLITLPDELVALFHWSWLHETHVDVALERFLDSLTVDNLALSVFGYLEEDGLKKFLLLPFIIDILVVRHALLSKLWQTLVLQVVPVEVVKHLFHELGEHGEV